MANTIGEGDRNLVRLNYISLLTAILEALQNPQANNPALSQKVDEDKITL